MSFNGDEDYNEVIYIDDDNSESSGDEENINLQNNEQYDYFVENFMNRDNQEFIKNIWGFIIKENDFPLDFINYTNIIHSPMCNQNLIFIGFNRHCPHINLINKNGDKYDVMSPYTGISIFRKENYVTYHDIYDTIHNRKICNNILKSCPQCHCYIDKIIDKGNNIYELKFKNNDEYEEREMEYNRMLKRIIDNKDPYASEELIYFEKLSLNTEFQWDINTKYKFL